MDAKILVVDDEKDICDIVQFNLESAGYSVDVAHSAEDALTTLSDKHNLILLDVMMGGMSGFEMAEKLRNKGNHIPIIFLTAKSAENDMLTGFSMGGDDYVPKPFSVKELMARVNAVLKRAAGGKKSEPSKKWEYQSLAVDWISNRVSIDGNEISLTKKEFDILSLLLQSSPNVLTRSEILNQVWSDNEFVLDRTVDVHITRLRKKLGEYASIIGNRSGFGYFLNID